MPSSEFKGSDIIGSGEKRLDININQPRWDQSTYLGRVKHFFILTDARNIFATPGQLDRAKKLVQDYRDGAPMDKTTVDELWAAKYLYDSAFHPDTGEKLIVLGRMSSIAPANMILGAGMLTFRTRAADVIFWQWLNQSINALVNYSNRSGKDPISAKTLGVSYVCATSAAVGTALGVNSFVTKFPPVVGRLVPLGAVLMAAAINLPIMRNQELVHGTEIMDQNGNIVGRSRKTAIHSIFYVFLTRLGIMLTGMGIPPFFTNILDKKGILRRHPRIELPFQLALVGIANLIANPLCCAFFPQMMTIEVSKLEPHVQESINKLKDPPKIVMYNKGL
ncbi:sideroflexin-3-like [Periplaneta americana]|uniref:sideroflexin-3-like n=1 Tax=Periplaneta americana TaxID=6978 RepID=UPI0037E94D1B